MEGPLERRQPHDPAQLRISDADRHKGEQGKFEKYFKPAVKAKDDASI